jgi:hypothetical protein
MAGKLKGFTFTVQSPPEGKSGFLWFVPQKRYLLFFVPFNNAFACLWNSVCKFFLMDMYARVHVDIN